MKTISIFSRNGGKLLYSGSFTHASQCLEHALADGISLAATDLRGFDLSHANLDGCDLSGTIFDGCDLTDSNLSECNLIGASFRDADLSAAVLCESRLIGCDFTGASFAGTLVTDAIIDDCIFACPTALSLDFVSCQALGMNRYDGHKFSTAPVVVIGLPKRIVFLDETVLIGGEACPRGQFLEPFENLFERRQNAAIVPASTSFVSVAPVAESVDAHDLKS